METGLTVDGQVTKSGTSSPLNLVIVTRQEVQDRVKRIPPDLPNLLFGDFSKRQSSRTLEVDIIGKREGGERGQW